MAEGEEDSVIFVGDDSVVLVDDHDSDDGNLDSSVEVTSVQSGKSSARESVSRLDRKIAERKRKEQENIERMYTKREVEKAHSAFLKNNSSSPIDRREASVAASFWASKHGLKSAVSRTKKIDKLPRVQSQGSPSASSLRASCSPAQADSRNGIQLFHCPVVNCQVQFSSKGMYDLHMTMMQHSPCHPYNHLVNRELLQRITTHVCPVCANTYRDREKCQEHMVAAKHDLLMEALPVGGYACPSCLKIYPEKHQCQVHMDSETHILYCHSFPDDDPAASAPVPFPVNVIKKYLYFCLAVDWHVECLMCARTLITTLKEDKIHHKTTKHTLMAFSDTSTTEVFAQLMRSYTCVQCLQLFGKLPPGGLGEIHQCSADVLGMIIENDCRTFTEFILRLGISLVKEGNAMAGDNEVDTRGPQVTLSPRIDPRASSSRELTPQDQRKELHSRAATGSPPDSSRKTSSPSAALCQGPGNFQTQPKPFVGIISPPICSRAFPVDDEHRENDDEFKYSNYASLLSAASATKSNDSNPKKKDKSFVCTSLTFADGRTRTKGIRRKINAKDGSIEALDINDNSSNSNSVTNESGHLVSEKTQEELDMEYALNLAQQFEREEVQRNSPVTHSSQIDRDHELAKALAEKINGSVEFIGQGAETNQPEPAITKAAKTPENLAVPKDKTQGISSANGSTKATSLKRHGEMNVPRAKRSKWDQPPENLGESSTRVSPPTLAIANSKISKRRAVSGDQHKKKPEVVVTGKRRPKSGSAVNSALPGTSNWKPSKGSSCLIELSTRQNPCTERGKMKVSTQTQASGSRTVASEKQITNSANSKRQTVGSHILPPGPDREKPIAFRAPPVQSHPVINPFSVLVPPPVGKWIAPPGTTSVGPPGIFPPDTAPDRISPPGPGCPVTASSGASSTSGTSPAMGVMPPTSQPGQLPSTSSSAFVPNQPPYSRGPYPGPSGNVPHFVPGRLCMDSFSRPHMNQPYTFRGGNKWTRYPRGNERYRGGHARWHRGYQRPRYYNNRPGGRSSAPEPDSPGPQQDPSGLAEMNQIVFLDIDNWINFFHKLPSPLPDKTLVWGFYGGRTDWYEPRRSVAFDHLKSKGLFHLHKRCGSTKDAADFAIVLTVGRMDSILPPNVAFTVLSGDTGFCEMEKQMKHFARRVVVINPHHKDELETFALIKSVGEA